MRVHVIGLFYSSIVVSRSFATGIVCPSLSLVWTFKTLQIGCRNSMEAIW